MRVLVIDHEVEVANVFGRAIEVMGHEVVVVHDSHDALSAAAGFSAQIVFLDLEVGGYELASRLRELPSLAGARIVALGPRGSHDARRASDTGVEHHVTKPIDLLVLATLLG
jgi:CheY-like chemotaxis protein